MIAGPNGSGKSTLQAGLPDHWIGTFLNADNVQRSLESADGFDLASLDNAQSRSAFERFVDRPGIRSRLTTSDRPYRFEGNRLRGEGSYFAAVVIEFLRYELLRQRRSMTFETVMSHRSKVDFLAEAHRHGYRTYLYFVATRDPDINVRRVQLRVAQGGHDVPESKIRSRYERSLGLLRDAVRQTDRAYLFDSSSGGSFEDSLIAEITDGRRVELKTDFIPAWVQRHLLT